MVLLIADLFFAGSMLFYMVWFVLNARSRFKHESIEGMDCLLAKAYFLKTDWCKGALLFKGFNTVLLVCSVVCPLMVLFDMAYSNLIGQVEVDTRIVVYTALSLLSCVFSLVFRFGSISNFFRNAYNIVNESIVRFEASGCQDGELLEKGISEGEKQVSLINLF